jgi:L-threonylcarbamoyladenylate synthase
MRVPSNDDTISRAADIIRKGGLVAFPTETVYGLGADAFNAVAAARIFEVKGRPRFDPLIVHIAAKSELSLLATRLDPLAEKLIDACWPGPLTVVLPKAPAVPGIVTAGLDTVAVRMPSHPVARKLIARAGTPIAAPSANPFGFLSPTRAEHVERQLGGRVDLILDGGPCSVGVESTIIKFDDTGARLLRPGGLALEEIEKIIGPVAAAPDTGIEAPGQLPSHYSPHTPVVILGGAGESIIDGAAYLAFRDIPAGHSFKKAELLSSSGDLREAAARFFSALHSLDECGAPVIYAEPVPETGLGLAIMDRLRRAAKKNP